MSREEQKTSNEEDPPRRRRTDRRRSDQDRRASAPGPVATAMAQGDIAIVFQPQFDLTSNRLVGAEALARWNGAADAGAPALFAAAAAEGVDPALSRHVQALAIRAAARWPAALDTLKLSVNVIAADLAEQTFETGIRALLEDARFPLSRLTLEITEGALIKEIERARAHLNALRADGVSVAVDDFGTGFSGLAWLKLLPVDILKLDRSLTADLARDGRAGVVARGVMALAHELGLKVVAEGVETEAERDRAATEGCAIWQGFLGSEPLDEEAFVAFSLRAN